MSNNVVQNIGGAESPAVIAGDELDNRFNGQHHPAPFLHDPSAIHNVSPGGYLKTDGLATLISHLQRVVSGRGPMQVIIAEHGRGKSSLIRQLITEAEDRWLLCYIHADYHLGVDHIISALGQTFFSREAIDFESLVQGLVTYDHQEPYPVVIVDDAQNISLYALETLANIKRAVTEQGGDVDIILCASPALRRALASHSMAPFKARWIELHALPRFTAEDTATYLQNRFKGEGSDLFTPSQLQIIHRRGCGIPACINYHAELVLGRAISDERLRLEHQQMLKRQKRIPYFIAGASAALLLLVVIIFAVIRSEPESAVEPSRVVSTATPTSRSAPATTNAAEAKSAEAKPVTEAVVKKAAVKAPLAIAKAKPATVSESPRVEPQAKAKPVASRPKPEPVSSAAAVKKEVTPQAGNTKTPSPAVATGDGAIPGVAWLKAQPAENFTIQLAGSPDEKNIIRYITRSSLEGELAYVLLERKNRSSWYVVLHGSFESRAQAQKMVEFFPPELRKHKPWIRKFSRIRKALDEN